MSKKPRQPRRKRVNWDADLALQLEADEAPQFTMSPAYNGGKLSVRGFDAPVVVDLSTASFEKNRIKINAEHDQKRVVGHAENQEIREDGIFLSGVLSKVNDDVNRIIAEAKNEFPHEASIEALFPSPQLIKAGQSANVNGKALSGPFYLARNAVITGVAILDRGADRHTNVSIAAEEFTMSKQFEKMFAELGVDIESGTPEELEAALSAKLTPPAVNDDTQDDSAADDIASLKASMKDELVAERKRLDSIHSICAEHDNPTIKVGDQEVSLEIHAMENDLTPDQVKLEALQYQLAQRSSGGAGAPAFHDATQHDNDVETIECALAISSGMSEEEIRVSKAWNEETVDRAMSKRFQGYRPSMAAYRTMQATGVHFQPGRLDASYIEACVEANRRICANQHRLEASGFTTMSLPGILSNVANKRLLAAYMRYPSIVPFVFGQTSSPDFKPMYSYQFEGSGALEALPKDGQIKHGKVVENQYTIQIETYAKMLAWTRQDMINDDLRALGRTASILGTMAYKARELAAITQIVDDANWTDTVNSFTANPLGIDGLTNAYTRFMQVTDADGLPIAVEGSRMLTPSTLFVLARQLQNDTEIRDTTTNKQYFISNPHAGTFTNRSTPWLDNAVANPGDANRDSTWYLFSDPATTPMFSVAYLNGRSTPTIESAETDFNTLGMQWRAYFDFGFGVEDPKYGQRNIAV